MAIALINLAWAAMDAKDIVVRIAAKCISRGMVPGLRGDAGRIREAVAATAPPRGYKKSRHEAVIREIRRQRDLRKKRADNRPINWGAWRPDEITSRQHRVVMRIMSVPKDNMGSVHVLRRVNGNLVMVYHAREKEAYYRPTLRVSIKHADGNIDSFRPKLPCSCWRNGEWPLAERTLFAFAPNEAEQALTDGSHIRLDFTNCQTVFTTPEGDVTKIRWADRQAECE